MLVDWQSAIFCHNCRFSSKRDDAARVFDSERASRRISIAFCTKGAHLNVKLKVSIIVQFTTSSGEGLAIYHFLISTTYYFSRLAAASPPSPTPLLPSRHVIFILIDRDSIVPSISIVF